MRGGGRLAIAVGLAIGCSGCGGLKSYWDREIVRPMRGPEAPRDLRDAPKTSLRPGPVFDPSIFVFTPLSAHGVSLAEREVRSDSEGVHVVAYGLRGFDGDVFDRGRCARWLDADRREAHLTCFSAHDDGPALSLVAPEFEPLSGTFVSKQLGVVQVEGHLATVRSEPLTNAYAIRRPNGEPLAWLSRPSADVRARSWMPAEALRARSTTAGDGCGSRTEMSTDSGSRVRRGPSTSTMRRGNVVHEAGPSDSDSAGAHR